MSKPQLSIITPVYNRPELLIRSVKSILSQSFRDFELLIIDDYSDIPVEVTLKDINDNRIRIYRMDKKAPNVGTLRKKACEMVNGKIVVIQDSDDVMAKDRLKTTYEFFKNNSEFGVCYGKLVKILPNNHKEFYPHQPFSEKALKYVSFIPNPTSAFRLNAYKKTSGYDSNLIIAEDYDLWLSMAEACVRFWGIDNVFTYYHSQPDSVFVNNKDKRIETLKYIRSKHQINFGSFEEIRWLLVKKNVDRYLNNPKIRSVWEKQ